MVQSHDKTLSSTLLVSCCQHKTEVKLGLRRFWLRRFPVLCKVVSALSLPLFFWSRLSHQISGKKLLYSKQKNVHTTCNTIILLGCTHMISRFQWCTIFCTSTLSFEMLVKKWYKQVFMYIILYALQKRERTCRKNYKTCKIKVCLRQVFVFFPLIS